MGIPNNRLPRRRQRRLPQKHRRKRLHQQPQHRPTPPAARLRCGAQAAVLQGKYNAEVPRLAAAAKAEKEAGRRRSAKLEELRKKLSTKPLVTPEEVKEFGEPLVDLARRIRARRKRATVEENEKLKKRGRRISALSSVDRTSRASLNTQAFFSALDAKHRTGESSTTPEFLKWMGEVDPLSDVLGRKSSTKRRTLSTPTRVARSSRRSRQTFSRGLLRALKLWTIRSCRQRRGRSGTRQQTRRSGRRG
jgi:hypothetical protein